MLWYVFKLSWILYGEMDMVIVHSKKNKQTNKQKKQTNKKQNKQKTNLKWV